MKQMTFSTQLRKLMRLPAFKSLDHQPKIWTSVMSLWAILAMLFGLAIFYFDEPLFFAIRNNTVPLHQAADFTTKVGDSSWILILMGILIIITGLMPLKRLGITKMKLWYRIRTHALMIFLSVALSGILINWLKLIFGRYRPYKMRDVGAYHFDFFSFDSFAHSFPSGHSTTIGVFSMLLVLWFPRWKWLWIILGAAMTTTRIMLYKHYPFDVIIGFNIGLLFTLTLARFYAQKGLIFKFNKNELLPNLKYRLKASCA